MEEKKPKRIAVHFDDEVFLYPNDTYYYRGTPSWSKKRLEFSLGVKKGASQKEIIKAKEDKLDDFKARGVRNIKDNFRAQSVPYIKDREAEAEDPTLLSQSSLKETKSIISKHLNPYFGEMHPADLDQPGFEDYCMEKRKYKVKGRKKAGINLVNHRKVLNHYMKWLFHKKVLTTLRTFEIPKKARVPRRERIVPEGHEVLSLFQNARGSLFLYITMYALMGTRSMEILHLRWDDINFEKRSMFINGMNNRTRKDRSIPINSYVFDILETRKKSSKSAWVFPNNRSNGKLPHKTKSSMRKVFVKLLKTSGVNPDLTPHDLRAFFESAMAQNKDFTDTQREKMAGANIDVQKKIYIKLQADALRGLENSVQIEGLTDILLDKISNERGGNSGGKSDNKGPLKPAKARNNKEKLKDV